MRYKVLIGANYRPTKASDEKRVEPGDVIEDWPKSELKWALAEGVLEEAEESDG